MGFAASRYIHSQRGSVAPLFAIALIALVASGALAWDISRGFALRAELEAAADAAAIAGASQLDGGGDAISRATTAAQGALAQNSQWLGEGSGAITPVAAEIRFLETLNQPRIDEVTTVSADAEFIEITLNPRAVPLVFGAIVGVTGMQARAHAVAGHGSALCIVPPLMICSPNGAGPFNANDYTGKGFVLTPGPSSGSWFPGQFGFINVGNPIDISSAVASMNPNTQCFGDSVQNHTGNIASVDEWFNLRFDLYKGSGKNATGHYINHADFPPAQNTMIGLASTVGDACTPGTLPAPSDDCPPAAAGIGPHASGAMSFPADCDQIKDSTKFDNGEWNIEQYFDTNHSLIEPSTYVPVAPAISFGYSGPGWLAYGPPSAGVTSPTRYQVYNWELALLRGDVGLTAQTVGQVFTAGQNGTTGSADYAKPKCYTGPTGQTDPDRRVISAVVANCTGLSGHKKNVPIVSDADFLMIAPVVGGSLYGEFIRATPAANSPVADATRRDWVWLYE